MGENEYNLLQRSAEDGVLSVCEREGLGFTPFSPLGGGWLTGKYRRGSPYPPGSRMTLRAEPYTALENKRTFRAIEEFEAVAADRGVEPATLAIAWVLSNPQVTAVVVGPRRPEQLEAALGGLELRLSVEERDELAALFA